MPTLHRAYGLLHVKAINEERRTITGTATSPTPDRLGDVIEPLGVEFTNPLPLLLYHNTQKPVGSVFFEKPTKAGIDFKAMLPVIDEPGTLRDRIEEAWQSVKAKLLTGVSIGFRSLEEAFDRETGGYHFLRTEVLELSLVAIPANADAVIATVKSLDRALAATGTERPAASSTPPGATGSRVVSMRAGHTTMKKPIADAIAGFENTRAAKQARIDALLEASTEKGETLDAAERDEYDGLVADVKAIDEHLVRLRDAETRQKALAKPVKGGTEDDAAESRSQAAPVITIRPNREKGIEFARYAAVLCSAKGNPQVALEIAKVRYPDEARIQTILKAAVGAGTTTDPNWAGALVQYQDFTADFIEFLRPATIIGKFGTGGIPSMTKVPFNLRVAGQTSGGAGYWVGEGKPKPLTKFDFTTMTMGFSKVANIAVLTEEEVRFSSPSAEGKVRDALSAALIERLDIDLIDPAKVAVANVSPASLTNGLTPIGASGTTAAAFKTDFAALIQKFIDAGIDVSSLVLIMSTGQALGLSLMTNNLGNAEFPNVGMNGGSVLGIPVIVSEYVTKVAPAALPAGGLIIAVSAKDVYLADDGAVVIDASREASLEMLDGTLLQDAKTGVGAELVSLWQNNLLGLKAERFINWKKRRADAVAYIDGAAYKAA